MGCRVWVVTYLIKFYSNCLVYIALIKHLSFIFSLEPESAHTVYNPSRFACHKFFRRIAAGNHTQQTQTTHIANLHYVYITVGTCTVVTSRKFVNLPISHLNPAFSYLQAYTGELYTRGEQRAEPCAGQTGSHEGVGKIL